ncbi:hypothetical protein RFM68_27490 [Mesorhizobium sp. MSK_1335]|uniref:Uncharacterized protein n=1 Tax=Mesorhizobium montanum TaxID=3072323 RepID=A0ABU4ZS36_9HYPH|nr:hypothetical protein [Mesorhizobium sp. MSK_1335]MDX8528224.1 hypothetical protein [Mesorhizobium sp. MSK_1335]
MAGDQQIAVLAFDELNDAGHCATDDKMRLEFDTGCLGLSPGALDCPPKAPFLRLVVLDRLECPGVTRRRSG